jgi:hypothetical protein
MTSLPDQERLEGRFLEVDYGSWASLRHATSDTELSIRSTRSLYSPSPRRSSLSDFDAHVSKESPKSSALVDECQPDEVNVAEKSDLRPDAEPERAEVARVEKKHKLAETSSRSVSEKGYPLSDLHPQDVSDPRQEQGEDQGVLLPADDIEFVDKKIPEIVLRREDAQNKIQNAVDLVVEKQGKVFLKRRQARDMRDVLNKLRDEETTLRAEVVGKLNFMLAKEQSEDTFLFRNLLETFQSFYDSYLKLENEYRYFELQLEQDELDLKEDEQKLASLVNKYPPLISSDGYDHYEIPEDQQDSPSWTSSGEFEELDPLTENYLSRLGDARIVRERLSYLFIEYVEACDRKRSRSLRGLALDQPTQLFISNYDETRSRLEKQLDSVEEDAALLRLKCEDQGLSLPEDTKEGQAARWRLDLKRNLPLNMDPLWVSELEDTSPFFETGMSQKTNGRNFINKWILHQLRHSSKEISRLKQNLQLEALNKTDTDVSKWILEYWFQDDTVVTSPPRTSSASEY